MRMKLKLMQNRNVFYFLCIIIMHIIHSSLYIDKQTTATQESDTGEVICSGNVSYGKVNMESDGFKNEDDGNEDNYDYL